MADQEPLDTTSQDDDHLPERIRVHALAKRLGVTSKRILAKLSELGTEVRSPQSSVDRAVAESVRESLTTPNLTPAEPGLFEPAAAVPETGAAGRSATANEALGAAEADRSTGADQAPAPSGGAGQIPGFDTETVAAGAAVWEPEEPPAPDMMPAGTGLAPDPAATSGTAASAAAGEQSATESAPADSAGESAVPGGVPATGER